jgi:hypothetical protein
MLAKHLKLTTYKKWGRNSYKLVDTLKSQPQPQPHPLGPLPHGV